jgi:hypothetical protein
VVEKISERTAKITDKAEVEQIWVAAYFLMGGVYDETIAENSLKGVMKMIDLKIHRRIKRFSKRERTRSQSG